MQLLEDSNNHNYDHQLHQSEALFEQIAAFFAVEECQLQPAVQRRHGNEWLLMLSTGGADITTMT